MKAEEKNKAVKAETQEQNKEFEEMVTEFMMRREKNKKRIREIKNSTICLGTIVGSMIAGVAMGEYEVLAHGAESAAPAFIGTCGALGGAIASGIYMAFEREESKIDERKLKALEQRKQIIDEQKTQTTQEDKSMKL